MSLEDFPGGEVRMKCEIGKTGGVVLKPSQGPGRVGPIFADGGVGLGAGRYSFVGEEINL